MAKLGQAYNVADIPEPGFDTLPPGDYRLMVTDSKEKATSGEKGAGKMVVLEIDVQDGEHTGRKLFMNYNIENPNPKAVDIAIRELGALARAVGVAELTDTEQLHNKLFIGTVTFEAAKAYKDKTTGEEKMGRDQNRITKYLPVAGASAATSAAKKTGAVTAAPKGEDKAKEEPAKAATPPWKGKKK